jgi:hypothetical protein
MIDEWKKSQEFRAAKALIQEVCEQDESGEG